MKKRYSFIFFLVSLCSVSVSVAEVQQFVREYSYHASAADTLHTSRIMASNEIKRQLLDEIGVFIRSVTTMKMKADGDYEISDDTAALTAGVVSFKILDEKWDEIVLYLKAAMKADPDEVMKIVKRISEDIETHDLLRDSLQELEAANRLITRLKEELSLSQNDPALRQKYNDAVMESEMEVRFQQAMNSYLTGNINASVDEFRALADSGNAKAQARFGRMYLHGVGVEQNYEQARTWLEKSAKQGNAAAMSHLGLIYSRGLGVEVDSDRALRYLYRASDLDSGLAYARLGFLYWTGQGVPQDHDKAFTYYTKSVELDNGMGYSRLGTFYEKGLVVEQDLAKAFELYSKGAEKGNPHAMAQLGKLYLKGLGTEKDHDKAYTYLKRAVQYGSPHGLSFLGLMYQEGWKVEQNHSKALELYQQSAEWGNLHAEFRLGIMYLKGLGVKRDKGKAVEWLKKADKKGFTKAGEVLERVESRSSMWR